MPTLAEQANKATIREASEILGVPYGTLQNAVRQGWLSARIEIRPVPIWGNQYRRARVRIVDLEEVEARYCLPDPVITDPVQLARERGIKYRSAVRHLQRKGLL